MLDHFRAHWTMRHEEAERTAKALREKPGRAAGRIAAWSIARIADYLRRHARKPLIVGEPGDAPTPHEEALLLLLVDLNAGRSDIAKMRAAWLVPPYAVPGLFSRAEPVAGLLPQLEAA